MRDMIDGRFAGQQTIEWRAAPPHLLDPSYEMKSHVLLTSILIGASLLGCGIPTKPYMEPPTGPVATITFVAGEGSFAASISQHNGSDCTVMNEVNALLSESPATTFVFTNNPIVKEKTINVAANSEFSFQINDARGTYGGHIYCGAAAAFTPMEGYEYRIIWSFPYSCGFRFLSRKNGQPWIYRNDLVKARICEP